VARELSPITPVALGQAQRGGSEAVQSNQFDLADSDVDLLAVFAQGDLEHPRSAKRPVNAMLARAQRSRVFGC